MCAYACGLNELGIMGKYHFSLVANVSGLDLLCYWLYLGDGVQSLQIRELLLELKNGAPHFNNCCHPNHL